jgi:hypothetical protein
MSKTEIEKALYGRKGRARIQVSPPEERTAEGIVFQSKHEMNEWLKFRCLERAGTITNLRRQVRYPLHGVTPKGERIRITEYRADIVCEDLQGRTCIYDPKGQRTERYSMIKKWFEVEYQPLRIVEL